MPITLTCACVQLPCTPSEWVQEGDGYEGGFRFHIIRSVSLQICSENFLARAGSFCLDLRFCITDTDPGCIVLSILELFCKGHIEKLREWLCRIYSITLWYRYHDYTLMVSLW